VESEEEYFEWLRIESVGKLTKNGDVGEWRV